MLRIIFDNLNRIFQEINGNKYLTLFSTNGNKEKIKKYEELLSKTRELIRSVTKNSNDYDEKYVKIKFISENELPLNKRIENPNMLIVAKFLYFTSLFINSQYFLIAISIYSYVIKHKAKQKHLR